MPVHIITHVNDTYTYTHNTTHHRHTPYVIPYTIPYAIHHRVVVVVVVVPAACAADRKYEHLPSLAIRRRGRTWFLFTGVYPLGRHTHLLYSLGWVVMAYVWLCRIVKGWKLIDFFKHYVMEAILCSRSLPEFVASTGLDPNRREVGRALKLVSQPTNEPCKQLTSNDKLLINQTNIPNYFD